MVQKRRTRPKLLIVAGAGASVEFGMPSVSEIGELLSASASKQFRLSSNPTMNLYEYFRAQIADYFNYHVPAPLRRAANFEEVLYTAYTLSGLGSAGAFTQGLNAFLSVHELPKINYGSSRTVGREDLWNFAEFMMDEIAGEFRQRCITTENSQMARPLKEFMRTLEDDFEIAVITTNYDNLIDNAISTRVTGFESSIFEETGKRFDPEALIFRKSWPCLLHIHGSVHFDLPESDEDPEITWRDDLSSQFEANSSKLPPRGLPGEMPYPATVFIAGYGKPDQLLKRPFRTYYSEMERMVRGCDALLVLGYGFSDVHLNYSLMDFNIPRSRKVVIIDYFGANMDAYAGRGERRVLDVLPGISRASRLFGVELSTLTSSGYLDEQAIGVLKRSSAFDRPREGNSVAVWYNGMRKACNDVERIAFELKTRHS